MNQELLLSSRNYSTPLSLRGAFFATKQSPPGKLEIASAYGLAMTA